MLNISFCFCGVNSSLKSPTGKPLSSRTCKNEHEYVALRKRGRVLDFSNVYILLIFISRQNKLVCAQRASKKITRFVPLLVHLLEIRRLGQLEYIAEAKIWLFFPPPFFPTTFVYVCSENTVHIGLLSNALR